MRERNNGTILSQNNIILILFNSRGWVKVRHVNPAVQRNIKHCLVLEPGFLIWGASKDSQGGASMAATHCWKVLNALVFPSVNLLSFHCKRHNRNKADKTNLGTIRNVKPIYDVGLSSTKPRIKLIVSKDSCILPIMANKLLFCVLCLIGSNKGRMYIKGVPQTFVM